MKLQILSFGNIKSHQTGKKNNMKRTQNWLNRKQKANLMCYPLTKEEISKAVGNKQTAIHYNSL